MGGNFFDKYGLRVGAEPALWRTLGVLSKSWDLFLRAIDLL